MKIIGITAKRTHVERYAPVFKRVYDYLKKTDKTIYIEKHVAELIGLKKYKEFHRGRTQVDLLLVMGGDGTILSVVRSMREFETRIFGINIGRLGFLSEIPPIAINQTLAKIFRGEYTIDKRLMLHVEVVHDKKVIKTFHALNEAVISQGSLARLIHLRTRVNSRKLTMYHADGLIISTPTGSTAYSLSAGGPILYPTIDAFILTPIAPHSFTQKPIVIPAEKKIDITVASQHKRINLSIDGQESTTLEHGDEVRIRRDGTAHFVRLPSESFFATLREKLDWGKN
ncbi:NAD(+)/NADH kinase [Candidatus Peregrinibacteria bacterium]|nr:NAD(+)/NADH kinase [Candidatus Peregrinibacteria bacterium]